MMSDIVPVARSVAALAASAALAGCTHYAPLPLRHTVSTFDQVGSIHVAVVSTVPFEALASKLGPGFEIKPNEALAEALAQTQATQTQVSTVNQALLKLAAPGADAPSPAASAPSNPQAPTPSAIGSPASSASAPALGGVTGHNALRRYSLAAALLQEVTLLNSYVRDAPRRAGYEPFIVRMQVTVRPRARATPFDAVTNVSFSGVGHGSEVVAVPLLVTDSEDVSSASSMDRNLTQTALALSALKGAYGLGGSFGRNVEDVVTSLGWHYQSVANVARINDQTISLRVGATPTGVNRFELSPRVHNMTVLLLVKRARTNALCQDSEGRVCQPVAFSVANVFVHATDGVALCESSADCKAKPAGKFEVFSWPKPRLPLPEQQVTLQFAGKKPPYAMSVNLRGGANLVERMVPSVRLLPGQGCSGIDKAIVAKDVGISKDRSSVEVQFDGLGEAVKSGLTSCKDVSIDLEMSDDLRDKLASQPSREVYGRRFATLLVHTVTDAAQPEPKKAEPLTRVVTDRRMVVSATGAGVLSVAVEFPKLKDQEPPMVKWLHLEAAGLLPGDPRLAPGQLSGCAVQQGTRIRVTSSCRFDLPFKNLPVRSPSTLSTRESDTLLLTALEFDGKAEKAMAVAELAPVVLDFERLTKP